MIDWLSELFCCLTLLKHFFAGCKNNKSKTGYNRLEADDVDEDTEFYSKGKYL